MIASRFYSALFLTVALTSNACNCQVQATEPIDIGSRRELFTDDHLIGETQGDVGQEMILPDPQEVVFVTDEAWEGNTSGYYTLFQDGDTYRMIYRGWQHDEKMKATHPEVTCYAESKDGIHWTKPNLGLLEWEGSKDNNIIVLGAGTHNFAAFFDTNPAATDATRYKALGGLREYGHGLGAFESPDCRNWKMTGKKPVITHGAFDSQNIAFWDTDRNEYRAYWRYFSKKDRVRAIRTATSQDFLTWDNEADLTYTEGTPDEHLYTNAIQKYFRAPHLFIGFPTRYEKKSQQVEPLLMTSRDGVRFHRYADPVVPRTAPKDRNHNRSNYMTWGMFQLPNKPNEISVYATENYYERTPGRLRRFTYRVDGFVALRGGNEGGTVTTRSLKVQGKKLLLNYVVRPGGRLTVEALNSSGTVVATSKPLVGDAVDGVVDWTQPFTPGTAELNLRFVLKNADVFSMKFE